MNYYKQKGFTLVEIAIVLVIVGLLIGGVLKGQEMITNAKIKRIESDNAGIAAAMFSYQDRYLVLPGDDDAAESRFDVYAGDLNTNGDGDGLIGGGLNDWETDNGAAIIAATVEPELFFAHLRAAGLIAGDSGDPSHPANAYGGKIGIQDGSLGISGHVLIFGNIDGTVAKILEGRLDDGASNAGRVQAQDVTAATFMDAGAAAAATYADIEKYDVAFKL